MKKTLVIVIIIGISIFLLIIPFIFDKTISDKISYGINAIIGLSSLLTFIIAILLYNKFGIEKSLLDKQRDEVFNLLEAINNSILFIQGESVFMKFSPSKPYQKFYEQFYGYHLIFSLKYNEGIWSIMKYMNHVFLPKEIAEKLRKFEILFISYNKTDNATKDLKIYTSSREKNEENFGHPNDIKISFQEYITNWIELIEEIENWISKNSTLKSELNI